MPKITKAMLEAALSEWKGRAMKAEALVAETAIARDAARAEGNRLRKERDHLRWRMGNTFDGVMLLAERAKASVQELAQLGLARLVMEEIDGKQVPVAHAISLDDLIDMGDSAMRQQATVAQFRQLKQHFVTHQRATTHLLDRITSMTRKNYLDAADMDKLRHLRSELSGMIGREL